MGEEIPQGSMLQVVYTLAPKYLYTDYFKAKVYTSWVHGPLGIGSQRFPNEGFCFPHATGGLVVGGRDRGCREPQTQSSEIMHTAGAVITRIGL